MSITIQKIKILYVLKYSTQYLVLPRALDRRQPANRQSTRRNYRWSQPQRRYLERGSADF